MNGLRAKWVGEKIEFPLLVKELTEQANRRRTYVIRLCYAAALFLVFGGYLFSIVSAGGEIGIGSLGQGRAAFDIVVTAQLIGVVLLLPAMIADVITRERERGTLDLLLITQLSPWDIILQKILSRLIAMGTFLLLSLPLIAVAYAYGGVETERLWSSAYLIILTCLWVGAVCVLFCVDMDKTSTAMMSCYVRLPMKVLVLCMIGLLFVLVQSALVFVLDFLSATMEFPIADINAGGVRSEPSLADQFSYRLGQASDFLRQIPLQWLLGCLVPPVLLLIQPAPPLWLTVVLTLPSLWLIRRYLRKSRVTLEQVMFANPGRPVKPSFEIARVSKDRKDQPRSEALPGDEPISWFELNSRTMLQLRKVFWFAVIIDLPLLLYLVSGYGGLSFEDYDNKQLPGFTGLVSLEWIIGALVIGLTACSAFALERTSRTLDVLLATPMPTAELIRQKLAAVRRLILLFLIPMVATTVVEWWQESTVFTAFIGFDENLIALVVSSAICLAIYPQLIVWTGLAVGLRIVDRTRAALAFLLILAVWLFIFPLVLDTVLRVTGVEAAMANYRYELDVAEPNIIPPADRRTWFQVLHLLNPATIVMITERSSWPQAMPGSPWLLIAINAAIHLTILRLVRRRCLSVAARQLGRLPDPKRDERLNTADPTPRPATS